MRPINPYIVGNPIKDQAGFFGRKDIFREVLQVLRQRESNAIVLFGQRRIGKTSVLLQLEKQLARDGEFTPVYFDLQDKASKSLTEVLYELSQHISKVTGHTVAKSTDFDRIGDYFRSVFLPDVAKKVASGGLVLLFDEFDVLDSPMSTQASEAFFPYLRAWMTDVQKVKFVFVIGRRPEDLSVRTMSTFKEIQSTRVSFLSAKDAEDVVRQSEKDGTLKWDKTGVQHVFDLTHGHPYFTQLLCSVIWENAYEAAPHGTPTIFAKDVDASVLQALKFGANAFNWLWDGLPPAERVVVAAMAEVQEEIITQERLIETLNQSGVRLVARELEVAPETLIDWEVLIEDDGAYRFAVPLLRRWVLANRPLRRVKDELDRLDPLAETLFQGGQGFYNNNNPDAAEQQLRQALNINPNHLKARLLLGQVLLEKGNLVESVDMFDAAYQYDERSARANLIKSLLALSETQEENLQLSTYERIIKIQSDQPLANEKLQAIWVKRGEAAQAQENYEEALRAFEKIGDAERVTKVRSLMHEKKLALNMQRADVYEKSGQWKSALDIFIELMSEYPESEPLRARLEISRTNWRSESLKILKEADAEENWTKLLELCEALEKDFPEDAEIKSHINRARAQLGVTQKYHEALGALQSGQADQARQMFTQVLAENPKHLQAAHKLIEATYGKVKITRPISWVVRVIVGTTAMLWTLLSVVYLLSLLLRLVKPAIYDLFLDKGVYKYAVEGPVLVVLFLAVVLGLAISYCSIDVVEKAFRVEQKEKPSLWKAAWSNFLFGMGLFYVDPSARRKWVYPVIAMAIPLLIILGPLFFGGMLQNLGAVKSEVLNLYFVNDRIAYLVWGFEERTEWWQIIFGIVLGGYLISFADVVVTCLRRIGKTQLPSPQATQNQAQGLQMLLAGFPIWTKSPVFILAVGALPLLVVVLLNSSLNSALLNLLAVLGIIWFLVAIYVSESVMKEN